MLRGHHFELNLQDYPPLPYRHVRRSPRMDACPSDALFSTFVCVSFEKYEMRAILLVNEDLTSFRYMKGCTI